MKNGIVNLIFENMNYSTIPHNAGGVLFTIGLGFRPKVNTVMPVIDANGLQAAAVYVDAGGAVTNF
jgi:hypothetical protein